MSPTAPGTDVLTPNHVPVLRFKLVVLEGKDFGAERILEVGSYRVGTAEGNELVLRDPAISGSHLRIDVLQNALRLEDLGSRNGSFCDGKRFTVLEVGAGAILQLGRTRLKVLPVMDAVPSFPPSTATHFGELAGQSLRMREVFALLERVAPSEADVLLTGETGTGKQLAVDAIHAHSARAAGPLVVCDVGSLTPTLLESELFGHVKGAFTGAVAGRAGAFERAERGTLFLDEIGELPLEGQPRLLRALEEGQVKRVGGETYRRVNVRVVAATHKDLEAEVAAGRFRQDLYYRLAVLKVALPPLRERREDIPFLISRIAAQLGKAPLQIAPELQELFCDYDWPGNVRQLRNMIELVAAQGPTAALALLLPGRAPLPTAPSREGPPVFIDAKEQAIAVFERLYVQDLLERSEGNVSQAARMAGMDRTYLHRLVKKHGLGR